ncbi:MAG TPA: hypothetical protein PKZ84_23995 [Anaerolineae bacterium]|nr:hypothetical protein [Anaerolineae bacterium]HQI87124.1 hypothetical protein [Anaerolineae bacterium]
MYYNLMELDLQWKARIAEAERRAVFNWQTRHLKSPEARLWEQFRHSLGLLRNVRLLPSFYRLRYAMQPK